MNGAKSKTEIDKILRCGTAASGMPADGQSPMIEMNAADMTAVIRFMKALMSDVIMQAAGAVMDPNLKPWQVSDIKSCSHTIATYIGGVIEDCENSMRNQTARNGEV